MVKKGKTTAHKNVPWYLRTIGVPAVLIPGLVMAAALGWTGWKNLGPDYYANKQVFPDFGYAAEVYDGDTILLENGMTVRLIGIDAPNRGQEDFEAAAEKLEKLIANKKLWFEYDRYQDDKFGRILVWVWIGCEETPTFLPADYMHKSNRESMPGLLENPKGCNRGDLVQEEMIKNDEVKLKIYVDRGGLKYEERLMQVKDASVRI